MFLGVVACPNQQCLESGAIGLYPIVKSCTKKRQSLKEMPPKRLKGEQYLKNVSLDKQLFTEMLQHKIIPDILLKSIPEHQKSQFKWTLVVFMEEAARD